MNYIEIEEELNKTMRLKNNIMLIEITYQIDLSYPKIHCLP
jgi:hypothetical protein